MFYRKKLLVCNVIASLFLVNSCAGLHIDPPGPVNQTLLVLPVEVKNSSGTGRHGFYYVYEIKHINNTVAPYRAILKLPLSNDMLVVDSLPPGEYRLDKFIFLPIGSGDFEFGNNVEQRYDRFTLEYGHITIFPQSLRVEMTKGDLGGGLITLYNMELIPVTEVQRSNIISKFKGLPNYESWKLPNGIVENSD